MSHYLKKIKKVIILERAFVYITNNNTAANHPYHNTRHLIKVFNSALEIAKKYDLNDNEIVELGLACLFHDMNHSGGKLPDNENIAIAIEALDDFYEKNEEIFYDWTDIGRVKTLIECTEYPSKWIPENISQQIIMDADLIQCFDIDWFIYSVSGLSTEFGVDIKQGLINQTKFLSSLQFKTKPAQKLHKKKIRKTLKRTEYLKNIFNK